MSKDGKKLLAMRVNFIDRIPSATDEATIGYFDLERNNSFVRLGSTNTFNWQQGCMLQWLGPDHNRKILFNKMIDGAFKSVVLDVITGEKAVLPLAVYSVTPDGSAALCIDNERHYWCRRGYSYYDIYNQDKNKNIVAGDGIFSLI